MLCVISRDGGLRHSVVPPSESSLGRRRGSELREVGKERTEFMWEELLTFPLWMGGAVGARFGGPVMARLWRRNLSRLKRQVERDDQPVGRLANA